MVQIPCILVEEIKTSIKVISQEKHTPYYKSNLTTPEHKSITQLLFMPAPVYCRTQSIT